MIQERALGPLAASATRKSATGVNARSLTSDKASATVRRIVIVSGQPDEATIRGRRISIFGQAAARVETTVVAAPAGVMESISFSALMDAAGIGNMTFRRT